MSFRSHAQSLALLLSAVCSAQNNVPVNGPADKSQVVAFTTYEAITARGNQSWMGDTVRRFWKFEHIGMMVLAIALVTIGRIVSKRAETERGKQLRIAIFYLLALLIMLMMIPWPFTAIGKAQAIGWF